MSVHKRRVDTLKVLVAGSVVGTTPQYILIKEEFDGVHEVQRIPNLRRRRLLQVLHSTRAMDSTLALFTAAHNIPCAKPSMGSYIVALVGHSSSTLKGRLQKAEQQCFQNQIVNLRNSYMHEAGAFPKHDHEVLTLLSDMESCLTRILSL